MRSYLLVTSSRRSPSTGRARASLPHGRGFLLQRGSQATFLHRQYHRLSDGYKTADPAGGNLRQESGSAFRTALHDHLSGSNIPVCRISTLTTMMHPFAEFLLPGMRSTLRASLAGSVGVNPGKVDSTLPAHPFEDFQKTAPCGIQAMLSQHPTTGRFEVQVLSQNHPSLVAKLVSCQEMELPAHVVDVFMQFANLGLNLSVIGRTFFLVSQLALQPSKLALQIHEKARAFYQLTSRYSQELFQPQVDADGFTLRHDIRDGNVGLQDQLCVPSRRLEDDPHLLDLKPIRDGSMQVDGHGSNFRQFDEAARCAGSPRCSDCRFKSAQRIRLELWKHKRAVLTKLLESGESESSFLHGLERLIQPLQSILQDLGVNCFQFWNSLFRFGQCILLLVVVGIGCVSRNDVFLPDTASIDRTLTRTRPVLALCQSVVIHATTLLQPVKHLGLLVKSWIDSVAVGQVQHSS